MKINYNFFKIGITLLLLMLPMILLASDTGLGAAISFFKGDGAVEDWFLKAFKDAETNIEGQAYQAAALGKTIGAFGALIYLGWLGWQMQEGARPWEVTPMIRPIIIGLILSNWVGFTKLIKSPLEGLSKPSVAMFNNIAKEADVLRIKRYELQQKLADKAIEIEVENRFKKEELDDNKGTISKMIDELGSPIKTAYDVLMIELLKMQMKSTMGIQLILAEVLENIALVILRVCVYGIFGFQKIWSFVLIIVGPIAVGMALIPGFENAMQSWIAKFININLYGFIAHNALSIGHILISSAYTMEINRLETVLKGTEELTKGNIINYMAGFGPVNLIIMTIVSYIVTGALVFMTPTIADSIVSAGGAGIASKMKQSAGTSANIGKKIGGMPIKAGKAIATKGTSLAKDSMKGIKDLLNKK